MKPWRLGGGVGLVKEGIFFGGKDTHKGLGEFKVDVFTTRFYMIVVH